MVFTDYISTVHEKTDKLKKQVCILLSFCYASTYYIHSHHGLF